MALKRLNIYSHNGCLVQVMIWIAGSILKFWETNTKTMIRIRKKKSGYQSKENSNPIRFSAYFAANFYCL